MTGARSDGGGTGTPARQVMLGRIGAAHGIKGEVRIASFCATPLDITTYGPLMTSRAGLVIEIVSARMQKDMVIARLKGVTSRNEAEALNGVDLFVDRAQLPPEDDPDDFYYADLIGLTVRAPDEREIGTVKAVSEYGAGDVVEIALNTGASALYAFTRENFPTIALSKGYLVLDPPPETEVLGDDAEPS